MLPRIADVGEWFAVLRDAVLARPPALLFAGEGGGPPADDRLNAYLLKAALLSAAASFVFERFQAQMRAVIAANPHLAAMMGTLDEVRAAGARVPVGFAIVILDLAIHLGLITAALMLLLRLAGQPLPGWRVPLAGALGVFVCLQVWRLAANWGSLKIVPWMMDPSPWSQLVRLPVLLIWLGNFVMPAIALGRTTRALAPGLARPMLLGILAYVATFLIALAITISGLEAAILRVFALPAEQ